MAKAIWKGVVLAESSQTRVVEGNHYFPPDSLNREHVRRSTQTTSCPWKGLASYYDVVVGDEINKAAAWYYPRPKAAAAEIAGYVAFWRGVKVERSGDESGMWSRFRRKGRASSDAGAAA